MVNVASKKIPTYFVRFEDLKNDPIPIVMDVFRFLLDVPSIEGTVLEQRILEKCSKKTAPKAVYKMKKFLERNPDMYSEEQLIKLRTELKDHLYFFGYTNHPEEEHSTAFFNYEDHEEADLGNFNMFKTLNENALASLGSTDASTADAMPDYHFNTANFMKIKMTSIPIIFNDLTFEDPE